MAVGPQLGVLGAAGSGHSFRAVLAGSVQGFVSRDPVSAPTTLPDEPGLNCRGSGEIL